MPYTETRDSGTATQILSRTRTLYSIVALLGQLSINMVELGVIHHYLWHSDLVRAY